MVRGLDLFREHFRPYTDRFVLIGGTACDIEMTAAGLDFRATKDLDIVLWVEALDATFVSAFWDFVRAGEYQQREKSSGGRQFYRFVKPVKTEYPFMLELFSREPDSIDVASGGTLTPLPMAEEVSSLSAILMDQTYYNFVRAGRIETEGLPVIGASHLIPLKARAWLDLSARKEAGEQVDSKSIKKHKNDVFRLFQIVRKSEQPPPEIVQSDMAQFLRRMESEEISLKALGVEGSLDEILSGLKDVYHLS
ncbi:MAG: nucleotidyl transferase AbiEii/AbiGii toxin family protein [Rhodothermales bacterium]|nr:nucleotidyl transferase AbiEii/AbiGii toxin family protein [Rhodothermales bacterium]MBO6780962.1 nucleotidyl transferase AbiEii/AbiGii toxin family protein [Rhodothermales bacterium]